LHFDPLRIVVDEFWEFIFDSVHRIDSDVPDKPLD